jgi:WS/DGAT/MGAT family acyltransferase
MRRLNGVDAGFLYTERDTQPCTPIFILELSTTLTLEQLHLRISRRLDLVPSFRWVLRPVPFRLNHPVWIWDPQFDLDFHLHHIVLESPGDEATFDRLIADISERPLDRSHPMWQITLVDGLEDSKQALVICVHHSMVDAVAALNTLSALFNDGDFGSSAKLPWERENPRSLALMLDGLRDQWIAWRKAPELVRQARQGLSAMKSRRRESMVSVPKFARNKKACLVNSAYSTRRSFARSTIRLLDLKVVKEVSGATMNETLLAITGAALRGYLLERGELPDRPLVTGVAVSLPEAGPTPRQWGCNIAQYLTSLATDVEDPWERLSMVSLVSREGRRLLDLGGLDIAPRLVEYFYPYIAVPALKFLSRRHTKHRNKAMSDLLVSNIPGPSVRWSSDVATVEGLWISGPPVDGSGLNVTFTGYGGSMAVAVRSNPDAIDSPSELVERIDSALGELLAVARKRGDPRGDPAIVTPHP